MKILSNILLIIAMILVSVRFVPAQENYLIPRKDEDGQYGYVNQFGKEKIDYEYDYAGPFHKNWAVVLKDDKFYYLDKEGNVVSSGYDLAYPFLDKLTLIYRDGKFAYIDTSFQIYKDQWFRRAYLFRRDHAMAVTAKNKFLLISDKRLMRVSGNYQLPVKGEVKDVVENMPYFPGGDFKLNQYLKEKLPAKLRKGLIYVSFLVEKDGSLKNISISGNPGKKTKSRIRKVFKQMPPWVPGEQAGKAVRVRMNIPLFGETMN